MSINEIAQEAVERGAIQKPWELAELGRTVVVRRLRTVVEIGTLHGGTAWFFRRIGLAVVTVDIDFSNLREDNTTGIILVRGNSPDVAAKIDPTDLVFIDGDHSYEGATSDWTAYRPKVRDRGLVAFHDVVKHPPEATCEVDQLWSQLSCNHPSVTIVDPQGGPWGGIGVLSV